MIFAYFLMFLCGAFTKFTDNLVDEPFKSKWPWLQYATGLVYGLLAGFLASSSPEFATLIFGIAIGVLLAGKIDSKSHQIAIAAIFAFLAFNGLPPINFAILGFFVGLGFLDEILNDLVDKAKEKGIQVNKVLQHAVSARLSLEIGTIAVGLATGNWIYFLALLSFDLAYNAIDRAMPFFLKKFDPGYGPQLAVDLYKCDVERLQNKVFLKDFLEGFPEKIGMRPISKAFLLEHNPKNKDESGISGFIIIAESHITIHTYPLKQLAKIDIVSCKAFDQKNAVKLLKAGFKASEAEAQSLYRGKHYPKNVKKAIQIVKRERFSAKP